MEDRDNFICSVECLLKGLCTFSLQWIIWRQIGGWTIIPVSQSFWSSLDTMEIEFMLKSCSHANLSSDTTNNPGLAFKCFQSQFMWHNQDCLRFSHYPGTEKWFWKGPSFRVLVSNFLSLKSLPFTIGELKNLKSGFDSTWNHKTYFTHSLITPRSSVEVKAPIWGLKGFKNLIQDWNPE